MSLFMDWYEIAEVDSTATFTGWSALEFADAAFVLLLLLAIATVVRPSLATVGLWPVPLLIGITASVIVCTLAITTTPIVELTDLSGAEVSGREVSNELKSGVFLAVAGAVLLLLAGLLELAVNAEARRR